MRLLDDLLQDLRYSVRLIRRSPAFACVAIVSLALGIGANTAIFTVVDALMLRPLPVRDAGQLVAIEGSLQYSMFDRLRADSPDAADLSAVIRSDRYNVPIGGGASSAGVDDGPVRLALVSGNYFDVLGADAARGRALAPDDDQAGARPVAVVADDYWRRRFASGGDIVGRTLTFGDTAYEIVGVAAPGFTGEWVGRPADVFVPIVWQPRVMVELPVGGLANMAVSAIGRLKGGVSVAQAQSAWQVVLQRELRQQAGPAPTPARLDQIARQRVEAQPASRGYSPQRSLFSQSLGILMAAVAGVLLIACANVAGLLLARSEVRRREMAVRLAVGARRSRLVRQLLCESLTLAAIGGVLGVFVAHWATNALVAFVRSGPATTAAALMTMDLDVRLDLRVLLFSTALCVVAGLAFGIVPAFRGSRVSLAPALMARGAGSGRAARGRFTLGKALVAVQVAISVVLLVGAGLLTRTLGNLRSADPGVDREHVLLVWALPGQTGGRGAAASDFWHDALSSVAALPGVMSVGASNQGVLNGSDLTGLGSGPALRIEGEPPAPSGLPGLRSFVSPGFFATMGITMLDGRDFTEQDTASAPRGVVITRALARHYFGDRPAVGHRIWFPEDKAEPTTIIGVVEDVLIGGPRETARRPGFTYFSYRDLEASRRLRNMTMVVRSRADDPRLAGRIREVLQAAPLNLPVLRIDTVDQQLADVLVQERLVTTVSAVFGILSLALASLGLYGLISYTVARRTNEIGIRVALGASERSVLGATLGEALALVAAGAAIGVPAALVLTRLIAARLFGVSPADPLTIAGVLVLLVAVTMLAGLIPARRAARIDPLRALRVD